MSKLAKALTAAAGNAGGTLGYVEDVFSTYLYTGNGSTQTITNGIDLDGEGGFVWIKDRTSGTQWHQWHNTEMVGQFQASNTTNAAITSSETVTSYNADGFSIGAASSINGDNYASWTFRKAEKFFDVVTYTGDGTLRNIPHNLGSTPAVIIVKSTSNTNNWYVQHTSLGPTKSVFLDTTSAATTRPEWGNTAPTDSVFTVDGTTVTATNYSGRTYVAYLFASDAGGFGDDGSESIIKCGSYTGNGSSDGPTVTLGFEPQWLLVKDASGTNDWFIWDVMRGLPNKVANSSASLNPNTSDAEVNEYGTGPTPTGFQIQDNNAAINTSGRTYIYIAIRRPMKTPESATEVFAPVLDATTPTITNFPVDFSISKTPSISNENFAFTRMLGQTYLKTASTAAEAATGIAMFDLNDGIKLGGWWGSNTKISWNFKRATGFFDVVAYTGNGSTQNVSHNLAAVPELIIVKERSQVRAWNIYHAALGATQRLLFTTGEATTNVAWNNTTPTSSVFSVGLTTQTNANSGTYIAYLFATLAGVSKVGSYTGTGSNVDVDCGFSAGARFILIKRTDSTGDWYVWDSVRGIVAGNDPYLLLNSTAAEVTSTDYIDPLNAGFTVTSSAPAALNASGGSYIFLAIS